MFGTRERRRTRPAVATFTAATLVLGAVGLAACSSSETATTAGTTADAAPGSTQPTVGATVTIKGLAFMPKRVEIRPGESVEFVNQDSTEHQPSSGTPDAPTDAIVLDTPGGASATTGPLAEGTYPYFCAIHTSMVGEIVVTPNAQASSGTTTPMAGHSSGTVGPAAAPVSPAASLRTTLNLLLAEHTLLAAQATGAALDGRTADLDAASAQLSANGEELTEAIVSIYGPEAAVFGDGWARHIGFFVDYTQAAAAGDQAGKDAARRDLEAYGTDLAAFLAGANPNLPADAVTGLIAGHVTTLLPVIDAQAAGDQAGAYAALAEAVSHMGMIADPLAGAIVEQFPDQFPGDPTSGGADLQVALNLALQQHVAYAGMATSAALGGRTAEYEAAAAQVAANGQAITDTVVSIYGPDAAVFGDGWTRHIGFFVDYTQAAAAGDQAGMDAARGELEAYAGDLAAFLAGANPHLPEGAAAELIGAHVTTLLPVIDDQAAGDAPAAAAGLRAATAHMRQLADPLAAAIGAQFPDQFPA